MIVATGYGDREVRSFGAAAAAIPSFSSTGFSYAGKIVDTASAIGIPAVLSAIRLISETAGTLPLKVYKSDGDGGKVLDEAASQWGLLHDAPNDDVTPSQLWSYVFAELNTVGNAYLQKIKVRGKVVALYPLEGCRVTPKRVATGLEYIVRVNAGSKVLTRDDLIHIPGILITDPYIGLSPIQAERQALGTSLAMQEFSGRFFSNDATPGGVLKVQGSLNAKQKQELRDGWNSVHSGVGAGSVAVLTNGAEYSTVSVPLRDAQFIEAQAYNVEDVARMFKIPADLLTGKASTVSPEEESIRFVRNSLRPWLVRVEQALAADKDLFPAPNLKPGFDADQLLRPDQGKRYEGYVKARQAGWMSTNEIRAAEGLPPVPDGDQVQITPVGGAPNPTTTTG